MLNAEGSRLRDLTALPKGLAQCALLASLVFSLGCQPAPSGPDPTDPLDPLRAAFGAYRPFEGRLAAGLEYAPCEREEAAEAAADSPSTSVASVPTARCSQLPGLGDPRFSSIRKARSAAEEVVYRGGAPRGLADRAGGAGVGSGQVVDKAASYEEAVLELLELRTGGRAEVSEGEAKLRSAIAAQPDDPRSHSDLAVVLIERAQRENDPVLLLSALGAAEDALALDPQFAPALFNRALTLELLQLTRQARAAWEAHLAVDTSSEWGIEAADRLAALAPVPAVTVSREEIADLARSGDAGALAAAVARAPGQARKLVEEGLLADWGEAVEEGQGERAAELLTAGEAVARALAEHNGERLAAEAVAAIEAAASDDDAERSALLARGHRDYGTGRETIDKLGYTAAKDLIEGASRAFVQADGPLRHRAAYWLAIGLEQDDKPDEATRSLARIVDEVDGLSPALIAEAHRSLGRITTVAGDLGRGMEHYAASAQLFRTLGERAGRVDAEIQRTATFRRMGEPATSFRSQYSLLAGSEALPPVTRYRLFSQLGLTARDLGEPAATVTFQHEVVQAAGEQDERFLAFALRNWAEALALRGDSAAGEREVARARRVAEERLGPTIRAIALRSLDLVGGELRLETQPATALPMLEASADYFREKGNRVYLTRALLGLARAQAALGESAAARATLATFLQEVEAERARQPGTFKPSFFARAAPGAALAARLAVDAGENDEALAVLERVRSRSLGEAVDARVPPPADTLDRLPPGVALISYAVTDDGLLALVAAGGGLSPVAVELPEGVEGLTAAVARLWAAAQEVGPPGSGSGGRSDRRATALQRAGAELHQLLIEPLAPHLPAGVTLVIVPDGPLYSVPFAALYDPTAESFLIEQRRLVIAPGAGLYLDARRRLTKRREATDSVTASRMLAVGDPLLAPIFTGVMKLKQLEHAGEEARAAADNFAGSVYLDGAAATPSRLFQEAVGVDLLHLAAHGLAPLSHPDQAALVLAPEAGESGLVPAERIAAADLGHLRLAVIAACDSGGGRLIPGEGVMSLGRAFLAAGVPQVLVSLWKVPDRTSVDFFDAFYRELAAGVPAGEALRRVQVAQIEDGGDPRVWAAFQLVGGGE